MTKKLLLLALVGLISFGVDKPVLAQNECSWGTTAQQNVFAHEPAAITVSNSVVTLTASVYDQRSVGGPNATQALVGAETNSIRVTVDGTAPTASVGVLVPAGQFIVVCGRNISLLKAIRATGSDGSMQAAYSSPN